MSNPRQLLVDRLEAERGRRVPPKPEPSLRDLIALLAQLFDDDEDDRELP